MFVIGVELAEIGHKTRVVQEGAGCGNRFQFVRPVVHSQSVKRKHVSNGGFFAQADEHVVAQQHQVTNAHHVAGHTIVLGACARAQQQALFRAPKLSEPRLIELLDFGQQAVTLGLQAFFQQLVAATFGHQAL